MYRFLSFSYGWLITGYSPREISSLQCFDAFQECGDSLVIASDDVDYQSFECVLA